MRAVALSLLGLALAVTCCGAPAESEPRESPEPATKALEPEGCGMVFSPVPELLDATEVATARWSAATGCDIRVGEGGVPVLLTDQILDPNGVERDGWAGVVNEYSPPSPELAGLRGSLVVLLTGRRMPLAVLHEMAHALGQPGHIDGSGDVLDGAAPAPVIGPLSLESLCSVLPCTAFRPESL